MENENLGWSDDLGWSDGIDKAFKLGFIIFVISVAIIVSILVISVKLEENGNVKIKQESEKIVKKL